MAIHKQILHNELRKLHRHRKGKELTKKKNRLTLLFQREILMTFSIRRNITKLEDLVK